MVEHTYNSSSLEGLKASAHSGQMTNLTRH